MITATHQRVCSLCVSHRNYPWAMEAARSAVLIARARDPRVLHQSVYRHTPYSPATRDVLVLRAGILAARRYFAYELWPATEFAALVAQWAVDDTTARSVMHEEVPA